MNFKKVLFLGVFLVLSIGFIFFNSSQSSIESNARSLGVAGELVMRLQDYPKIDNVINTILCYVARLHSYNLTGVIDYAGMVNLFVRKLAHGFEFFLLGLVLNIIFYNIKLRKINRIIYSLFLVLLSACCDEFFQLFIAGRTSTVEDVLIDFIGGIFACVVVSLSTVIYEKLRK